MSSKQDRRKRPAPDTQWTAIPAKRSRAQDANFRAKLVLGVLAVCAVLGLLSTVAWMATGKSDDVEPYTPPVGGGVAAAAAHLYLSGQESVAPAVLSERDNYILPTDVLRSGGSLWPESVVTTRIPLSFETSIVVEKHTFLFVQDGRLLRVTVPVSIQADGTPTVAGTPALSPYEIGLEEGTALELIPAEQSAPTAVVEKLERWAQAYMGDRRGELADIAGDVQGSYSGIGGWVSQEVALIGYGIGPESGVYIARVRVTAAKESDPALVIVQMYDLVVDQRGEVPYVVRWGPIGTR